MENSSNNKPVRKDAFYQTIEERYFWWSEPGGAKRSRRRILAQLMDIGDYADVEAAVTLLGLDAFADVLRNARPGWLRGKSWTYWQYRCGLTPANELPPKPPVRTLT